jgi:hypothetical protein
MAVCEGWHLPPHRPVPKMPRRGHGLISTRVQRFNPAWFFGLYGYPTAPSQPSPASASGLSFRTLLIGHFLADSQCRVDGLRVRLRADIPVREGQNAGGLMCFSRVYIHMHTCSGRNSGAVAGVITNMQNQKFDHALVLKMTTKMRDDIDRALVLTQDTLIRSRSEFIRAACQCFLDSLAKDWGGGPVSVEKRKARVLAGPDEMNT